MAFARVSAIRGALRTVRPSTTSVGRPQLWRQVGRRGYASHGHQTKKAGGDLPWYVPISLSHCNGERCSTNGRRAIGAVAVTVPTCWYLLQSGPEKSHGHGDHG